MKLVIPTLARPNNWPVIGDRNSVTYDVVDSALNADGDVVTYVSSQLITVADPITGTTTWQNLVDACTADATSRGYLA